MNRDILTENRIGSNSVMVLTELEKDKFEYLPYNWSTISEILDYYNLKGKGSIQDIALEQEDIVFFKKYFKNKFETIKEQEEINVRIKICL